MNSVDCVEIPLQLTMTWAWHSKSVTDHVVALLTHTRVTRTVTYMTTSCRCIVLPTVTLSVLSGLAGANVSSSITYKANERRRLKTLFARELFVLKVQSILIPLCGRSVTSCSEHDNAEYTTICSIGASIATSQRNCVLQNDLLIDSARGYPVSPLAPSSAWFVLIESDW